MSSYHCCISCFPTFLGRDQDGNKTPKLLASRRAHKAHLTKLRHKIDETAEGTIAHNEIALLKSLVNQLKQKKQILKELNDEIAVLLETPEELEAEILDAEELDSLIVEKVSVTDNLIELAKRNLSQHVLSHSPEKISIPSGSPQKGQENQEPIPSTSQTNKKINNPIHPLRLERPLVIFKVKQPPHQRILRLHRRR